jgi:hypothetical protein
VFLVFAKGGGAMTGCWGRFPSSACGIFSRVPEKSCKHSNSMRDTAITPLPLIPPPFARML